MSVIPLKRQCVVLKSTNFYGAESAVVIRAYFSALVTKSGLVCAKLRGLVQGDSNMTYKEQIKYLKVFQSKWYQWYKILIFKHKQTNKNRRGKDLYQGGGKIMCHSCA